MKICAAKFRFIMLLCIVLLGMFVLFSTHSLAQSQVTSYSIQVNVTGSGNVTPSGTVVVSCNTPQTFTITPNTFYVVSDVQFDGISVGALDSYTFDGECTGSTASENTHTLAATFNLGITAQSYSVETSTVGNGDITPSAYGISCNTSRTFTITPHEGYKIQNVLFDDVSVGAVNSYTVEGICTGTHTLEALFASASLSYLLWTQERPPSVQYDPETGFPIEGTNPLLLAEITDLDTDIGFVITDEHNEEAFLILGEKDASGILRSVERAIVVSLLDDQNATLTFNSETKLPESFDFQDGTRIEFGDYTDTAVEITTFDSSGNIVDGPQMLPVDMEKIRQSQTLLQGVYEPVDQTCGVVGLHVEKEFTTTLAPYVEGTFLAVHELSCAVSVAAAAGSIGLAVPAAIWTCGTFVLNTLDYLFRYGTESGTTPPIITKMQEITNPISMIIDVPDNVTACIGAFFKTNPKDIFKCGTALAPYLWEGWKTWTQYEPPTPQGEETCQLNPDFDDWCDQLGGVLLSTFGHNDAWCTQTCKWTCGELPVEPEALANQCIATGGEPTDTTTLDGNFMCKGLPGWDSYEMWLGGEITEIICTDCGSE